MKLRPYVDVHYGPYIKKYAINWIVTKSPDYEVKSHIHTKKRYIYGYSNTKSPTFCMNVIASFYFLFYYFILWVWYTLIHINGCYEMLGSYL